MAVLLVAAPARAQTADETETLRRLAARAAALHARLSQTDSAARIRHDTVAVRTLLLLTDSAAHGLLQDALPAFQAALDRTFGPALPAVLAGAHIVVRFGPPDPRWGPLLDGRAPFVQVDGQRTSAAQLARALTHAVEVLLTVRGGAGFADWHAAVQLFGDEIPLWDATYVELISSTYPGAVACNDGELDACRRALHLDGGSSWTPADAAGLPAFIEGRLRHRSTEPKLADPYRRCVGAQDPAACTEFLERAGIEEPGFSTRARGTLLRLSARLAGPDAYGRFYADTAAPLEARLEHAAGMPLDSLVAAWRATVESYRPAPVSVPLHTQWAAVGWVLLLLGLASRSTRWR